MPLSLIMILMVVLITMSPQIVFFLTDRVWKNAGLHNNPLNEFSSIKLRCLLDGGTKNC